MTSIINLNIHFERDFSFKLNRTVILNKLSKMFGNTARIDWMEKVHLAQFFFKEKIVPLETQ